MNIDTLAYLAIITGAVCIAMMIATPISGLIELIENYYRKKRL